MFRQNRRSPAGFTVVEALVVVAVVGVASVLLLPALQQLIHVSKIRGVTNNVAVQMRKARFEAIKRGAPCVVMLSPASREVVAFADVHGAALTDLPDGLFNPVAGEPPGATDYEISRIPLPSGVSFKFGLLENLDSVDGFDNSGDPDPPDDQAIFLPNGSVNSPGALRFGDQRGNHLEVRIDPPSTARIEVRKHHEPSDEWRGQGEGGETWTWK